MNIQPNHSNTNTGYPTTSPARTAQSHIRTGQAPRLPLPLPSLSESSTNPPHSHSILSTTAGLDTVLLTLNYTLVLLHAQLDALSTRRLTHAAHALVATATDTAPLLRGETLLATLAVAPSSRLLRSSRSLRALADLVADVRVFLRLWGLLGIWSWAGETWRSPPRDAVLRGLAWAQVGVNVAYQALENAAYLAQHGVLRVAEERQARWWVWSSRFWMAHVLLDFGRLVRVRALRGREGEGEEKEGKEKEGKVQRWRDEERWWRELYVDAAYAPLTVHGSLENGCVSEAWVGFLGMVAGAVGLRGLWAETA